ncbi:MAG: hypothetical protein R3A11_10165 [Bdellovibrionota bacterium]
MKSQNWKNQMLLIQKDFDRLDRTFSQALQQTSLSKKQVYKYQSELVRLRFSSHSLKTGFALIKSSDPSLVSHVPQHARYLFEMAMITCFVASSESNLNRFFEDGIISRQISLDQLQRLNTDGNLDEFIQEQKKKTIHRIEKLRKVLKITTSFKKTNALPMGSEFIEKCLTGKDKEFFSELFLHLFQRHPIFPPLGEQGLHQWHQTFLDLHRSPNTSKRKLRILLSCSAMINVAECARNHTKIFDSLKIQKRAASHFLQYNPEIKEAVALRYKNSSS